ncbi:MAG: tRNA adenosine(34) deaminase TadA [Mariprofundaceae bacterium]
MTLESINEISEVDHACMQLALEAASQAAIMDEVPVGALLKLPDGKMFSAHNAPISSHDATAHAEICVIREASAYLKNYRLNGSTLYVTLEPCCMCAGAIIHSRIGRVVYGATDPKTGAAHSLYQLLSDARLNHQPEVCGGIDAEASSRLLRFFFQKRR